MPVPLGVSNSGQIAGREQFNGIDQPNVMLDGDVIRLSAPGPAARRLKRVFDVEIETCMRCGGQLKIIASIEEPQLIAKILSHLESVAAEHSQSELPQLARGPPAQSSLL